MSTMRVQSVSGPLTTNVVPAAANVTKAALRSDRYAVASRGLDSTPGALSVGRFGSAADALASRASVLPSAVASTMNSINRTAGAFHVQDGGKVRSDDVFAMVREVAPFVAGRRTANTVN